MKVTFLSSEKEREDELAEAFLHGVALDERDTVELVRKGDFKGFLPDADICCMVGVKSFKIFQMCRKQGMGVLFFDKGYLRHRGPGRVWEYWRIGINAHHPTAYLPLMNFTPARFRKIQHARALEFKPWRQDGSHIVYAGSSEKYHNFYGLPEPTAYAEDLIAQLKKVTKRRIIYRPKPTWYEAEQVKGANFSPRTESINTALVGAWAMVTNGSNACFEAAMAGIPSIVLGEAVAKPISSTTIEEIENPRLATEDELLHWLSQLFWCQFTEDEMRRGLAWRMIRAQLTGETFDEKQERVVVGEMSKPSKAIMKRLGSWKKKKNPLSKEEQRKQKPFTKTKVKEKPDEDW